VFVDHRSQTLRTRKTSRRLAATHNTDVARSALSEPLPKSDDLQTVKVILGKLREGTRWPIELFRPTTDDTADSSVLQKTYLLFVWNEEADSFNETLENQLENLK